LESYIKGVIKAEGVSKWYSGEYLEERWMK
jgi:hypothetical protein